MPEKTRIRQARLEEANLLTEVTLRSKAHWQYDAAFLAATKHELEFQPSKFLPDYHVYVLEEGEKILGFGSLIPIAPERIELHDLFVEPGYIGKGHGKRLWDHAIQLARGLRSRTVVLTADPHAERFICDKAPYVLAKNLLRYCLAGRFLSWNIASADRAQNRARLP